jgi:PGF-pre-PGF domain-containing protein/PGF-CTERM protein
VATYLDVGADRSVDGDVDLSVRVDRSTLDEAGIAPEDAVLLHYVDGGWVELSTEATTGGGTVTLTATADRLSPFAVAARSADGGDGGDGGGGGGGSSVDGGLLVSETRVTETFLDADTDRATVVFGEPTTGSVAIEAVDALPSTAPAPEGTVVTAVDITVPDDSDDVTSTVEITMPRSAVEAADASPGDLRIVRFDGSDAPDRLDTDVVSAGDESVTLSAETPGFSTFAVVALDAAAMATATPDPTPTATAEPTATATPHPPDTPEPTATATPESTATPEPTTGDGPGFGPVAALLALATLVALGRRRPR